MRCPRYLSIEFYLPRIKCDLKIMMTCSSQRPFSRPQRIHKTILDAIHEHQLVRNKRKRNPSIPQGGSIPTPKPPTMHTQINIQNNGARRIPTYYLGGRRVNAHGMGIRNTVTIHPRPRTKNNYGWTTPSTAQKEKPPNPIGYGPCHPKPFPL